MLARRVLSTTTPVIRNRIRRASTFTAKLKKITIDDMQDILFIGWFCGIGVSTVYNASAFTLESLRYSRKHRRGYMDTSIAATASLAGGSVVGAIRGAFSPVLIPVAAYDYMQKN